MPKKIAINGFGRIGRLTLRRLLNNSNVEVVAINDLTDNATLAHLFKYDSAHGIFPGDVNSDESSITISGRKINSYSKRNPQELPWKELGVDVVLECTGVFRNKEKAGWHLEAGAQKVILSAPAKGDGFQTIVLGVNDDQIKADTQFYSNASCTTNCLAPLYKTLDENWGIVRGNMTTTHSYTSNQRIQDAPHSDLRRARAAAVNIVPTTTGAAVALSIVYPNAAGKLFASSIRVPVITGSLVELTVQLEKETTAEAINAKFKELSKGRLKGVLEYSEAPLVSSDIISNPHSTILDAKLTVAKGDLVKVIAWYDNEAGYSARLADLADRV